MSDLFEAVERIDAAAKQKAFLNDPSILAAAIPRYRAILANFDELMRANKVDEACELEEQANALAVELWGEHCGCIEAMDRLAEATAARAGEVPMWGQRGEFVASLSIYKIRFEFDGLMGIGGPFSFSIHAVEWDRPFFSESGYRSFCGYTLASIPEGSTVDKVLVQAVRDYANKELKGKYPYINPQCRPAAEGERFYLFDLALSDKPVGDLDGYRTESAAKNNCHALRAMAGKGAHSTIVSRGPYTREAFLAIIAQHGWAIPTKGFYEGAAVAVASLPQPLEYCEGCGDPVACCSCGRCEECGEPLNSCECDDTVERELEPVVESEPVAVLPIAAEPEQLSLF